MPGLRRAIILFCVCLVSGSLTGLPSQSTDQNPEKIQALQKQLDEMKAQMESVQAQINALSLSSAASGVNPSKAAAAPPTGNTAAATAATPSLNAQQDAGAQAVEARLTPARQVNPATASYQTTSQDQIAAPRIDNAPLDPRYPDYFDYREHRL